MMIEITYKFDINKYQYEVNTGVGSVLVDGSKIIYEYVDKMGKSSKVEVLLKTAQNLLGNDIFACVLDMPELYAKINFLNHEEYINFILPNWLVNFKYID